MRSGRARHKLLSRCRDFTRGALGDRFDRGTIGGKIRRDPRLLSRAHGGAKRGAGAHAAAGEVG